MRTLKISVITLLLAGLVATVAGVIFIYSGEYPIGADIAHSRPVFWLLKTTRDRAVAVQSRGIKVPDLSDPKKILIGAGQYAAMCSTCHLAPGYAKDETWEGLYPQPPKLYQGFDLSPAEVFWVLKHGLKMSGMPAWGPTHEDDELWDIVAFVEQLPKMKAQQYKAMVAKAPPDEDMMIMPMPGGGMPAASGEHGDAGGMNMPTIQHHQAAAPDTARAGSRSTTHD